MFTIEDPIYFLLCFGWSHLVSMHALSHLLLLSLHGFDFAAFCSNLNMDVSICRAVWLSGSTMPLHTAPSCASCQPLAARHSRCEAPKNVDITSDRRGHANPDIRAAGSAQGRQDFFARSDGRSTRNPPAPGFGFGACVAHVLPAGCYCFCSGCCYIRTRDVAHYEGITAFAGLPATDLLQLDTFQISLMCALVHMQREVVMLSRRARMLLEVERDQFASIQSLCHYVARLERGNSASHRMCIRMSLRIARMRQLMDYAEEVSRMVQL